MADRLVTMADKVTVDVRLAEHPAVHHKAIAHREAQSLDLTVSLHKADHHQVVLVVAVLVAADHLVEAAAVAVVEINNINI